MAHARKPSRRAATGPPVAEPASPIGGDRRSPVVVGRGHQRRLDLTLVRGSIADVSTRALVLSLFANVNPTGAARAVDERLGGAISDIVPAGCFPRMRVRCSSSLRREARCEQTSLYWPGWAPSTVLAPRHRNGVVERHEDVDTGERRGVRHDPPRRQLGSGRCRLHRTSAARRAGGSARCR